MYQSTLFLALSLSAAALLSAQTVLDLRFSEQSASDTASGRHVTLENVLVVDEGGRFHGDLDGDGAVVVEAADPDLSFAGGETLWVELWVNLSRPSRHLPLLSKGNGANYRMTVDAKGIVSFSFYAQGEWRSWQTTEPLAFNEWQHIGCLVESPANRITFTLNGVVNGTAALEATFQSRDSLPLTIAGGRDGAQRFLGVKGFLGRTVIARGNYRNVPEEARTGEKVFEVEPDEQRVSGDSE